MNITIVLIFMLSFGFLMYAVLAISDGMKRKWKRMYLNAFLAVLNLLSAGIYLAILYKIPPPF